MIKLNQRLNLTDKVIFLRQFATLLAAGVPLLQCCNILERSQSKIALRLLIYAIKREILLGKTLFQSLRPHTFFDALTLQLIHLGECTGQLDKILMTLAKHQEKNLALKKQIRHALFYPAFIALTAMGMALSLLIFVVPRFADLFQDAEETLPFLTHCVFYLSSVLQHYGPFLLIFSLLFIYLIYRSLGTPSIKQILYRSIIRFPFIKTYTHKIVLAQFTRNLAITVNAGLPLIEALSLAASPCHNKELIQLIATLGNNVQAGLQLHQAMAAFSYFPLLMVQMIKIGEEAGKLEPMLDKSADFFEADIAELIGHVTQLLEPLIMLVLGVLIGGLVISMYLPIFKVGSAL